MPLSPQHRKVFVWRDQLGLTNLELMSLIRYLLRRDVKDVPSLTDAQVTRVLDALEGAHLVIELYAQRPPA